MIDVAPADAAAAFDGDDEQPDLIDLDEDAVLAEVDDPAATVGEAADGDVLVLDTWQITIPATGDDKVDAALARLTEVEGLPPTEHAEVYEAVHGGLQDALADLDRG